MFDFVFDNFPPQSLDVAHAEISLYVRVPPWRDNVSLYVEVVAEKKALPLEDTDYSVAPTFYTEWLEIPLQKLQGRGLDLLDRYHMVYNVATEEEDGYDQFPGAVYQNLHAGFVAATMMLTHLNGADYRIEAEGETEFGWKFRIDTVGKLTQVTVRSGMDGGDKEPSPEVEAWYDRLFDPLTFPSRWVRKGSEEAGWYVLEGAPAARD